LNVVENVEVVII